LNVRTTPGPQAFPPGQYATLL